MRLLAGTARYGEHAGKNDDGYKALHESENQRFNDSENFQEGNARTP